MPPRVSLPSIVRQCRSIVPQQVARLTGGSLRDLGGGSTARALGNLDNDEGFGRRGGQNNELVDMLTSPGVRERSLAAKNQSTYESKRKLLEAKTSADYMSFQPREFVVGDVVAPHDFNPLDLKRFTKPPDRTHDVLDLLNINPIDNYQNFTMISEYMSPMGRIKKSAMTRLRPVNQRKMAKAVRRAIGLGIHPSVHQHPEIIGLHQKMYRQKDKTLSPVAAQYKYV